MLMALWGISSSPVFSPESELISCNLEGIEQQEINRQDTIEVIFENERKSLFRFKELNFSLQHPSSFNPVKNEEIPWINPESFTDQNGNFIVYQQKGANKSIREPYIRVQYISRDMEHCDSIEAIYAWLDSHFLGKRRAEELAQSDFLQIQNRS